MRTKEAPQELSRKAPSISPKEPRFDQSRFDKSGLRGAGLNKEGSEEGDEVAAEGSASRRSTSSMEDNSREIRERSRSSTKSSCFRRREILEEEARSDSSSCWRASSVSRISFAILSLSESIFFPVKVSTRRTSKREDQHSESDTIRSHFRCFAIHSAHRPEERSTRQTVLDRQQAEQGEGITRPNWRTLVARARRRTEELVLAFGMLRKDGLTALDLGDQDLKRGELVLQPLTR